MNRAGIAARPPPAGRVFSAAVATCVALCILVALGVWQIERLRWKEAILVDIARAEAAAPVPLTAMPSRFAKVFAAGILLPNVALYGAFVRTARDGSARMGAERLQVLETPQGAVLVDLGWVPTEGAAPAVATGPAVIAGYVRLAEHPRWYSPDDDPKSHLFYTLDPAVIGPNLAVPRVGQFTLVALGKDTDMAPIPATALPRPPNNHLQYALTWFCLAAALAGVFGFWLHAGRSEKPSDM